MRHLLSFLAIAAFTSLSAQPGSIDTSFCPGDLGVGHGLGASNSIQCMTIQSDGRIVIVGGFTQYDGVIRNRIARLHINGDLDTSFDPGTGFNGGVECVARQSDGKLLVGGLFISYNGVARNSIARLNADGSLDTSFDPGTGVQGGFIGEVYAILIQSDGKIIIGGEFTTFNGTARRDIARLNTNGSLDTSFNPGSGTIGSFGSDAWVRCMAIQTDGKILIGGAFDSYNGTSRKNIARLNANGSVDTSFNPGTGANGAPVSCTIQPDGRILIAGFFSHYNGTSRSNIARINTGGTLDTGFDPGTGANGGIQSLALLSDGSMIIGGYFTNYNGIARNRVAKVIASGQPDTSFNPGSGIDQLVYDIKPISDAKFLVAGVFSSVNGVSRGRIASLNQDGSLDLGNGADNIIRGMVVRSDGKILIGGDFTSYRGTTRNRIAGLNANGTLDAGFNPGSGANEPVHCLAVQPDGKILIGGYFTSYNGTPRNRIAVQRGREHHQFGERHEHRHPGG